MGVINLKLIRKPTLLLPCITQSAIAARLFGVVVLEELKGIVEVKVAGRYTAPITGTDGADRA